MIIAVIYATYAVAKRKPVSSAVQICEFSYIHFQKISVYKAKDDVSKINGSKFTENLKEKKNPIHPTSPAKE